MDTHIFTGHEDGTLSSWDVSTGEAVFKSRPHTDHITDMQMSVDSSYFVTSSKDHTALLIEADPHKLTPMKKYQTERPINSASIVPGQEFVLLGGGQEAMQVTTTSTRIGKFEVRFFSKLFEMEIGRVKGHFGPINTVAASPDGLG
jgi:translation initiation factor 3 subunit I